MSAINNIGFIIPPLFWNKMPSLGIASLAAYLESQNVTVSLTDANIELFHRSSKEQQKKWLTMNEESIEQLQQQLWEEEQDYWQSLIQQLILAKTQALCLPIFKTNRQLALNLAQAIKQVQPAMKIIFGGPELHYAHNRQETERYHNVVDHMIVGEGEWALWQVLQGDNRPLIVHEELSNIRSLPPANFSLFPLHLYLRRGFLPIAMSRGCIQKCSFCAERLLRPHFATKEPEAVVAEIKHQQQLHKIPHFIFHDSLINAHPKRLEKLCQLIIQEQLNIKWEAQFYIRTDIDRQLLALMKQSGCYNIFIGMESASSKVLQAMNKGYTQKDILYFLTELNASGLHGEISLIVGYPGEEEADFWETYHFLKNNKPLIPKIAQVNGVFGLPGTPIEGITPNQALIQQRVRLLCEMFEQEKIIYTPAFINNL